MPDTAELQAISGRLERGEIDSAQYLEQLMRFVAARIGCSRAGLRVFVATPEGRVLRSLAMYDAQADQMVGADDLLHPVDGPYLERLHRDGSVMLADAATDPIAATSPLRDYLDDARIASLLDTSLSVNGVLYGVFSCEQRGAPAAWLQRQQTGLRQIASRAGLTLMHVINTTVDTAPGALWESSTPNRLSTMPTPLRPIDDDAD